MKNDVGKVYEILGLAGSGKTTLINALKKNENLIFNTNKKIGIYLISHIPTALYILYKTKNIIYARVYLRLQSSIKYFMDEKNEGHKKLIFDQGPIYIISILIKEVPSLEAVLLKELNSILKYYTGVIYLETSLDTLHNRIHNRVRKHRVKDMDIKSEMDFLNEYIMIYKKILDICLANQVSVNKIDTDRNDIMAVERLALDFI